jgi:hypothetical protein
LKHVIHEKVALLRCDGKAELLHHRHEVSAAEHALAFVVRDGMADEALLCVSTRPQTSA